MISTTQRIIVFYSAVSSLSSSKILFLTSCKEITFWRLVPCHNLGLQTTTVSAAASTLVPCVQTKKLPSASGPSWGSRMVVQETGYLWLLPSLCMNLKLANWLWNAPGHHTHCIIYPKHTWGWGHINTMKLICIISTLHRIDSFNVILWSHGVHPNHPILLEPCLKIGVNFFR